MFRKLQVTLFTNKTHHQNVFQAANDTIYAEEIDLAKTFDDILLSPLFSWDCWLKNHDPSPRVSFFLTAQLRHYSPFWKLFNLLTAPVYCACCALIGSLLTWPWLALKIDITASLDSGHLSFSLCTVLNEKGDRGTVWKWIKRAEGFEFSSAGDFAIERKNGRNYVERKIFRPKRKGWHLCMINALTLNFSLFFFIWLLLHYDMKDKENPPTWPSGHQTYSCAVAEVTHQLSTRRRSSLSLDYLKKTIELGSLKAKNMNLCVCAMECICAQTGQFPSTSRVEPAVLHYAG